MDKPKLSYPNLRPQLPGTPSHNPLGRKPSEHTLLSCIKAEMLDMLPFGKTREQVIAATLVRLALEGDLRAIELILAYTHPKPREALFNGSGVVEILVRWEEGHAPE